jgi:hypothetical protein
MSIKFASIEHLTQRDRFSPLIEEATRRNSSHGRPEQNRSVSSTVGKITFVEALVRALDATFILMVMQDERHYIGEQRQAFVPRDDPELIDHVTNVVICEGAKIRREVESVFFEAQEK